MATRAFAKSAGRMVRIDRFDAASGPRRTTSASALEPSRAFPPAGYSSSPLGSMPSARAPRSGDGRHLYPLKADGPARDAGLGAERGFASAAPHNTDANPVAAPGPLPDTGRELPDARAIRPAVPVFASGNPAPMGAIDMVKPWRSQAGGVSARGLRDLLRQPSQNQIGRM